MESLPRSLVVVGSGVIGCEYASMFRALGIEVKLLGGSDRLLPFLDKVESVYNHPTLGEAYKYAAYDGLQDRARREGS
jgi:NADPH-dependent 2,4-dienoyl-CoA reductase/sulfur reductase-like enzyme